MKDKAEKLVEQYDLEVLGIRRGRGSYIYETDKGVKVLKPVKISEERVKKLQELMVEIEKETDILVGNYIIGREEKWICENEEGEPCVLKDHLEGREWNPEKEEELANATEILGRLHLILKEKGFPVAIPWNMEVEKRNREIKRTRNFIRTRKRKTPFELLFLQVYPEMEKECNAVSEKLREYGFEKMWQKAGEEGQLCHGDYTYHNLVHCGNVAAVLNFESVYQGLQVDDLYHFLRKAMEKNDWDFKLLEKMLERYKKVCGVSLDELKYLWLRFSYPEKFWKIANHYQNSRKTRIPEKDMKKLETLIGQAEKKKLFLDKMEDLISRNAAVGGDFLKDREK